MNTENRPPGNGRIFYSILERADGRADVFLDPHVYPLMADGMTDYDITFKVVRGIDPADYGDLDEHIRAHYEDWRDIAEDVSL